MDKDTKLIKMVADDFPGFEYQGKFLKNRFTGSILWNELQCRGFKHITRSKVCNILRGPLSWIQPRGEISVKYSNNKTGKVKLYSYRR